MNRWRQDGKLRGGLTRPASDAPGATSRVRNPCRRWGEAAGFPAGPEAPKQEKKRKKPLKGGLEW